MKGIAGWVLLALVAPAAVVLGYRQYADTREPNQLPQASSAQQQSEAVPDQEAKSRRQARAELPVAPSSSIPAESTESASDLALGRAIRNAVNPTTQVEALRDIESAHVEVSVEGDANQIAGFQPKTLKSRLETRLRQFRVKVDDKSLTVVKLYVYLSYLQPNVEFAIAANVTVERAGLIFLPSTRKFMVAFPSVYREAATGRFGTLRIADARAVVDGLFDTLVNDLLKENPGLLSISP